MKEYYCEVCGRKHSGKHSSHYCRKHQWQIENKGCIYDHNPRSKFDPNEFRFIGNDIVEFDTYKLPSLEVDCTYRIDAEDYPLVSKYKWRTVKGYANNGITYLHRLLSDAKPGQQVDHINLDITDNRKSNLRIADNSLNQSNKRPYNKLGIKGVEYHKGTDKYSAYLRVNNRQYHSPCYKTVEEACFARFILEQMFREEELQQFNTLYINNLSARESKAVIDGLKRKFNRE